MSLMIFQYEISLVYIFIITVYLAVIDGLNRYLFSALYIFKYGMCLETITGDGAPFQTPLYKFNSNMEIIVIF